MDKVTKKAISAIFEIMEDIEKAKKLDEYQSRLGFSGDFFSFSAFLDCNQNRLVDFLDCYFADLTGMDPESDFGGLASYALYDAATPYIDGKPYNLKDKDDFEKYIEELLRRRSGDEAVQAVEKS